MDSFEEALTRLDRHIWYMAHRFGSSIKDQDIDDLHQEGVIKLYEIYSSSRYVGKCANDLDAIFKRSLSNMLKDLYAVNKRIAKVVVQMPTDYVLDYGYDAFVDVYVAYHKLDLSNSLSADAVRLLDLLLEPTPAVYRMYNITVMRRKALLTQGQNVRIPTKITQELVGHVLGFSLSKTKNLIRELKQVWEVQCQNTRSKCNSKPNAAIS